MSSSNDDSGLLFLPIGCHPKDFDDGFSGDGTGYDCYHSGLYHFPARRRSVLPSSGANISVPIYTSLAPSTAPSLPTRMMSSIGPDDSPKSQYHTSVSNTAAWKDAHQKFQDRYNTFISEHSQSGRSRYPSLSGYDVEKAAQNVERAFRSHQPSTSNPAQQTKDSTSAAPVSKALTAFDKAYDNYNALSKRSDGTFWSKISTAARTLFSQSAKGSTTRHTLPADSDASKRFGHLCTQIESKFSDLSRGLMRVRELRRGISGVRGGSWDRTITRCEEEYAGALKAYQMLVGTGQTKQGLVDQVVQSLKTSLGS